FTIGKYIQNLSNDPTSLVYLNMVKILEGYLLTDAIYLQVDSKNIKHLKNFTTYIDGPLMLRMLGLKSKYENQAAQELLAHLKKFGVKICVFEHTRDEIIDILTYYSKNIGNFKYSTLEHFDNLGVGRNEILDYIIELDDIIKNLGIEIHEKPRFDERFIINAKTIREKIYNKRTKLKYNSIKAVDRDIESISSINTLRRGRNFQSIEACNYIFVTTYTNLKK